MRGLCAAWLLHKYIPPCGLPTCRLVLQDVVQIGLFPAPASARCAARPQGASLPLHTSPHLQSTAPTRRLCRPVPGAGSLDVEGACRGFLDLAKEAAAAAVALVFADPAFADLLSRLYASDEWRSGAATASVLATLEDFLRDFERWVLPPFYRRHASLTCSPVGSLTTNRLVLRPTAKQHGSSPPRPACPELR